MSFVSKFLPLLVAGMLVPTVTANSTLTQPAPLRPSVIAPVIAGEAAATVSMAAVEAALSPVQLIERWAPLIQEASQRFKIPASWIKAVMRKESGGRTLWDGKPITSDAGAMGIMQVMPETYEDMRAQNALGADPYDPRDNLMAGAAYLSWLHGKYGYPRMFAAYNAGPGTLEASLAGTRSLPAETRAYVNGIGRDLGFKASDPAAKTATAILTRPDGSAVAIDRAKVVSIRAALPDEFVPGVKTVVAMGDRVQGVREDLKTVGAKLKRKV